MKVFLLVMVATCLLLGCKKEHVSAGLFGKWELRKVYGGIAGFDSTYNAGNGRILQLGSDSTYTQFQGGKMSRQGTYQVTKQANVNGDGDSYISFDHNDYSQPLKLAGTTLTIGVDVTDQIASQYQKLPD